MKIKNRLLAVQGPQQLIAGVIAMEWYARTRSEACEYRSVLVMYDFLMPEHLEQDFVNVIGELSRAVTWDKVAFIGAAELGRMMKRRYTQAKAQLRERLGEPGFDEIHIGRDFCGDGSPLILNAYPDSAKLLYGDAFGLVGNEAATERFDWRNPARSAAAACKKYLKSKLLGTHKKITFDAAVLTLPLDWTGTYLNAMPLLVPSQEFVVDKIEAFSNHLPDLNAYADALLAGGGNNYLFLLSNLAASGYMAEEAEIALYVDTVRKLVPPDGRVLFKAHPRAPESILNGVMERVAADYPDIKIIDDASLSRFPIELWVRLLQSCTIIPVFSTSALNLKYFYDKNVILPLTEATMKRYCYPGKLADLLKVYQIISQSVANLGKWDGRTVLWKGNEK
jgi:hypothetical protein